MSTPAPPDLLTAVLGDLSNSRHPNRPHVTLTFAQSLDAKIAGAGGTQLILSGRESMVMTHWMRAMHNAILVGIGTALNDDPQLNTRHLPPLPDGKTHRLPQPIVVDSQLRLPPTSKLLANHAAGTGKQPWLAAASECRVKADQPAWAARKQALEDAGARIIHVPTSPATGGIVLVDLLAALYEQGVRSLMVEGGARMIDSFLANSTLVDTVIVTVAPLFVGKNGVGYGGEERMPVLIHVKTEMFGRDVVTALKVQQH